MRLAVLILLLASPVLAADPPPRAKAELLPKDGAWVGQRVTLAVTLWTPDLFAGAPAFDLPPIPGAVVLPPASSPVLGSETVDGASFTTQRHEFAVYAQRAGEVHIPAFPIRFESNAGFGKPIVNRQVTAEAVSFTAKTPPGAKGLGTVIAARHLKVSDEWTPEPKAAKVGDAFTRTLTVTASDVPGMVFPSFRLDGVDGLAAYPKPPTVDDRTERGGLTGRRVETVTYVCAEAGTVAVPDRTLTWYDLEANELRTAKLPGRTFAVAAAPKPEPATAAPPEPEARPERWRSVVVGGAVLALVGLLAARLWARCARRYAAWSESEAASFARLRRASRTDDPHAVFVALLGWLDRFGVTPLDEFARRAGDPELTAAVAALTDRVYARHDAHDPGPWSARPLFARTEIARRKLRFPPTRSRAALPPLNPTG